MENIMLTCPGIFSTSDLLCAGFIGFYTYCRSVLILRFFQTWGHWEAFKINTYHQPNNHCPITIDDSCFYTVFYSVDQNMCLFHAMASCPSVSFPPWYVYKSVHFIKSTWSINKILIFACLTVFLESQSFLGRTVEKL